MEYSFNGVNYSSPSEEDSYEDYHDEFSDDEEEEKEYPEEEPDEEAHISLEQRNAIINSIGSYAYDAANKEEENCAVCLSNLESKQQIKNLPCKHMFHSK